WKFTSYVLATDHRPFASFRPLLFERLNVLQPLVQLGQRHTEPVGHRRICPRPGQRQGGGSHRAHWVRRSQAYAFKKLLTAWVILLTSRAGSAWKNSTGSFAAVAATSAQKSISVLGSGEKWPAAAQRRLTLLRSWPVRPSRSSSISGYSWPSK